MTYRSAIIISLVTCAFAADPAGGISPRIYIQPDAGLESYLSAAIVKKHVPAVVTTNKDDARFVLTAVAEDKPESTGGKIARCLFAYCIGIQGQRNASVRLVDAKTQEVVWAYNVQKVANANQSAAEAVAKHLKKFLEERPR